MKCGLNFVAWVGPDESIIFLGQKWADQDWLRAGVDRRVNQCALGVTSVSSKKIQHILNSFKLKPTITRACGTPSLVSRLYLVVSVVTHRFSWVFMVDRLPLCDLPINRRHACQFSIWKFSAYNFTYKNQNTFNSSLVFFAGAFLCVLLQREDKIVLALGLERRLWALHQTYYVLPA